MVERAELVFEAQKGQRLHKRFIGVTTFDWIYWSEARKMWVPSDMPWLPHESSRSSTFSCRTLKAFKRHLRKHPELDNHEVILVSRFVGFNVTRPAPQFEARP